MIVLSATSGGVSIICFASIIGASRGIATASFALIFSLTIEIIKKVLKIARNKKKKHNTIIALTKSKLNSIATLMSQALIDTEISNEEFKTIVKGKKKHERIKKDIRMIKSSEELTENNRNIRENRRNAYN